MATLPITYSQEYPLSYFLNSKIIFCTSMPGQPSKTVELSLIEIERTLLREY